jgi:hypothetical protein
LTVFRVPFGSINNTLKGSIQRGLWSTPLGITTSSPFLQLKVPVTQGILHTSINNHEQFVGIVMGVPDEFPLRFHQFYLVIIELGKKFVEMKLVYQTGNNTDIK